MLSKKNLIEIFSKTFDIRIEYYRVQLIENDLLTELGLITSYPYIGYKYQEGKS